MIWLLEWLKFKLDCGQTGCVVFDIDDTLVKTNNELNKSVAFVFHFCIRSGIVCNIVTARRDTPLNRRLTLEMLAEKGIVNWNMLFLMPKSDVLDATSVSEYKRQARDIIEEKWKILANIGDMWHDLIRFPLVGSLKVIQEMQREETDKHGFVFFPPMSHDEVSIKLKST